jgi:ferredoxin
MARPFGANVDMEATRAREASFYLCGPPTFLEDVRNLLKTRGVAASSIHWESFGSGQTGSIAGVPGKTTPPHQPGGPAGTGPRVNFTRSGLTVSWDERFGSLLELAEACSIDVAWSCRAGVCHRCETGLIGGEVEYLAEPLDPPGAETVLLCCAKPVTEIEIDA